MTKEEYLFDVVKYYAENTNRRCARGSACYYNPKVLGKEDISKGCAIGMYLTEEAQIMFDEVGSINAIMVQERPYFVMKHKKAPETLLPEWMREMPLQFLQDVQSFHDKKEHWENNQGLSSYGLKVLVGIVENHNLNKGLLTDYLTK